MSASGRIRGIWLSC